MNSSPLCTAITPFQLGRSAFDAGVHRDANPYHPHEEGERRAEWEAGYNHAVGATVIQPEDNSYASDVYTELLVLARSFEERQYFSAAQELREMAARGPEQHRGMDHFSTQDVLTVASERLAEAARMAERQGLI